jgi:hypothetical protein
MARSAPAKLVVRRSVHETAKFAHRDLGSPRLHERQRYSEFRELQSQADFRLSDDPRDVRSHRNLWTTVLPLEASPTGCSSLLGTAVRALPVLPLRQAQ